MLLDYDIVKVLRRYNVKGAGDIVRKHITETGFRRKNLQHMEMADFLALINDMRDEVKNYIGDVNADKFALEVKANYFR